MAAAVHFKQHNIVNDSWKALVELKLLNLEGRNKLMWILKKIQNKYLSKGKCVTIIYTLTRK